MDLESVVDEILSVVLHGGSQHDDPFVQERIIRSEVWNLIEEFEGAVRRELQEELGIKE